MKCNNCIESASNCIDGCANQYYLFNGNSCLSSCPEGYTGNIERKCVKCEVGTKKCSFDNSTKKTISEECLDKFFLYNELCIKSCPRGYYEEKSTKKCEGCHKACLV